MAIKKRLIAFVDYDALEQDNTTSPTEFLTYNDIQTKAHNEQLFTLCFGKLPKEEYKFKLQPQVEDKLNPRTILKKVVDLVENQRIIVELSYCDPRDYYLQLAQEYVGEKYELDKNGFDPEAVTNTNNQYTTAVIPAKNKNTNEIENFFFKVDYKHATQYKMYDENDRFVADIVMFDMVASPLSTMSKKDGERTNTKNTEALDVAKSVYENANLILKYMNNTNNQKMQKQMKIDSDFKDKINIVKETVSETVIPKIEMIINKYQVSPARLLTQKEKDIIYKFQYICDASKLQGNPATWVKNNYNKFMYLNV